MRIWRTLVVSLCWLAACSVAPSVQKIALLAPFEGRYRDVGYEALYAVRLALADAGAENVHLLAVDDGGSVASAVDRARALERDPAVKMALVLGLAAADERTLSAFERLPVLVVGHWGAVSDSNVTLLAPPDLPAALSVPPDADFDALLNAETPLRAGEVAALDAFATLRDDLDDVAIISGARLPTPEFRRRYVDSDPFAPEPRLWAMLSYDATSIALAVMRRDVSPSALSHEGYHGRIAFNDAGYWDAPLQTYALSDEGHLFLSPR